ncbi:MAG: DUF393 domain-containing protein [Mucilaginibacter polytrichastri]|nr:DUF393 domain-containing protein [Mucilaginibacter polytrichastri]
MKTLENHVIFFDAECPMCKIYTKAFVAGKILEPGGRMAYQEMPEQFCAIIDRQRAVNEIALIDKSTGEVTYGISSLFKIIAHRFPMLAGLFSFGPFIRLMTHAYAFVSYNRRVIVPGSAQTDSQGDQPGFNLKYRVAYLVFTWFFTALILSLFAKQLTGIIPAGKPYREYLVCGLQIALQGFVALLFAKEKLWNYLGNMMTISFAGALALLPLFGVMAFATVSPGVAVGYFIIIVALMFLEHIRRCRLLGLGRGLTASWAIYRVLVLCMILNRWI